MHRLTGSAKDWENQMSAATAGLAALASGVERQAPKRHRSPRPEPFRTQPTHLQLPFSDSEIKAVSDAAESAGLTVSGFLAAAGLAFAGACVSPPISRDRALLREALELRGALIDYAAAIQQGTFTLANQNHAAPAALLTALSGCVRAAEHLDELAVQLLDQVHS